MTSGHPGAACAMPTVAGIIHINPDRIRSLLFTAGSPGLSPPRDYSERLTLNRGVRKLCAGSMYQKARSCEACSGTRPWRRDNGLSSFADTHALKHEPSGAMAAKWPERGHEGQLPPETLRVGNGAAPAVAAWQVSGRSMPETGHLCMRQALLRGLGASRIRVC